MKQRDESGAPLTRLQQLLCHHHQAGRRRSASWAVEALRRLASAAMRSDAAGPTTSSGTPLADVQREASAEQSATSRSEREKAARSKAATLSGTRHAQQSQPSPRTRSGPSVSDRPPCSMWSDPTRVAATDRERVPAIFFF